jgi:hypothetical protein
MSASPAGNEGLFRASEETNQKQGAAEYFEDA